jgi:hypothetical protein
MQIRLPLAIVLVALATAVVLPASASASDQSVWNAYAHSSSTAKLRKAVKKFSRAFKRLSQKTTNHRLAVAGKASRRLAKAAAANRRAIKREDASSDDGARGRSLLLKALAFVRKGALLARDGVKAGQHQNYGRANRLFKRGSRALKKANRYQERGEKAMAAGIEP